MEIISLILSCINTALMAVTTYITYRMWKGSK